MRCRSCWAVLCWATIALGGCASDWWSERPALVSDGPALELSDWARRYRTPDRSVKPQGVDPKAREIERSLGIE